MSSLWVMLPVVWAFVEVIQWARKKPMLARLKSAFWWSTILTSLSSVGQMDPGQNALLQFAVSFVMFGVPAGIFYGVRRAIAPNARKSVSPSVPSDAN